MSRDPDQNGIYLDYITCLRYAVLVRNPQYAASFGYRFCASNDQKRMRERVGVVEATAEIRWGHECFTSSNYSSLYVLQAATNIGWGVGVL